MTLLAPLRDYYELSKPRIIVLLLITTAASMVMAARGMPPLPLLFWTLLAGALAAASAGAFNCVWDADIDRVMKRTQSRPIPQGRISRRNATIYAAIAGGVSFGLFYVLVNPLAAWLSLAGNLYYVVIYTIWLKRVTPLNIVVGGAAGSVPPLVGWAAVTHSIGAPALGLFALIFLWTPPHFWSLALMTETEYGKAKIPMFPTSTEKSGPSARSCTIASAARSGLAAALSAARHGRVLFRGCGRAGRGLRARRVAHVARADDDAASASALSLLAALPRADVRGDGDRPHRIVNRLLWTLSLGVFAGALDLSVLSPALPALGRDFNVQIGDLAWVFTIYLLVTVLSIALSSTLADRYGRRPIYLACLALFAAGSIVAIAAPSYADLPRRTRDSSARRGRDLPRCNRDDRRRRSRAAARCRAWNRRGDLGPRGGNRSEHRRPHHALRLLAMDFRCESAACGGRLRAGPRRRTSRRAAPTRSARHRRARTALHRAARRYRRVDRDASVHRHRWASIILGCFAVWESAASAPIVPLELLRAPQLVKTYALEIVIGVLEGSLFFIPTVLVGAQGLSYVAAGFVAALGAFTFVAVIPFSGRALDRIGSRDVLAGRCRSSPSSVWRSLRSDFNRCRSHCSR